MMQGDRMTEVPPSQRTGPKTVEDISDATLEALRCAAVAHGQDKVVAGLDQEEQRRSRRKIRR